MKKINKKELKPKIEVNASSRILIKLGLLFALISAVSGSIGLFNASILFGVLAFVDLGTALNSIKGVRFKISERTVKPYLMGVGTLLLMICLLASLSEYTFICMIIGILAAVILTAVSAFE